MNQEKITLASITNFFADHDEEARRYVNFHKYRYKYLLEQVQNILAKGNSQREIKLLDIGPAFQTALIRHYFPTIKVDTLGFKHPASILRENENHYYQNLNQIEKEWEIAGNNYDIILFCEVIEHLYSRPENILEKLKTAMADHGSMIVQTPNAVAIHKRLKLLAGYNPYNLLKENKIGHFREYTVAELKQMMQNVGMEVKFVSFNNYFNNDSTASHRAFVRFEKIVPKSFRDGITIVVTL